MQENYFLFLFWLKISYIMAGVLKKMARTFHKKTPQLCHEPLLFISFTHFVTNTGTPLSSENRTPNVRIRFMGPGRRLYILKKKFF